MKKIGLFFGTFNPIHIGHIIIANHISENTQLDQVWFVVTPQSPHKQKTSLLSERQRYEMVYRATKDYHHLEPSDIEFGLKKPSYTTNTLAFLEQKFPNHKFILLLGEDNLVNLHKWKNASFIADNYTIYVYPRHTQSYTSKIKCSNLVHIEAPKIEISSSFIRGQIAQNKEIRPLLPLAVWMYIDSMNFYKTPTSL